jgi:hypothetical protein
MVLSQETKRGAKIRAPFYSSALNHELAPLVMVETPRRFCAQQSSLDSVQIGRSLP